MLAISVTGEALVEADGADATGRVRDFYQQYTPRYDHQTSYHDRFLLGDRRARTCRQAHGSVLEVAIGTGRNLCFYPPGIRLTGIDLTSAMLSVARNRARDLGMPVALVQSDAQSLPFADATFDTVVCTLALNAIPDDRAAIAEMYRTLQPAGTLLLLGHVASHLRPVRALQRLLERKSLPIAGDHQTREPVPILRDVGFTFQRQERSKAGIIQAVTAIKPVK